MQAQRTERNVAFSALSLVAALLVVGVVSAGVRRHLVQTAPEWIIVWLGLRGSRWTKWVGIPCFAFWLLLMAVVWMYLLGWTRVISGTFSPVEIAMTLVVGASAVLGLVLSERRPSGVPLGRGLAVSAAVLGLQVLAFMVSFQPGIAHD
jgi:hypothetical protein